MSKCVMCGQCCRQIFIEKRAHEKIQANDGKMKDADFGYLNWEFTGEIRDVSSHFPEQGKFETYVYTCKWIDKDNKCTIHREKPHVCSGYPWYDSGKGFNGHIPWGYKGCGYEKDHYEMRLLRVLHRRINSISEKAIDE